MFGSVQAQASIYDIVLLRPVISTLVGKFSDQKNALSHQIMTLTIEKKQTEESDHRQ
jgi:hypothetical protein